VPPFLKLNDPPRTFSYDDDIATREARGARVPTPSNDSF
jgi:hypothetical protein